NEAGNGRQINEKVGEVTISFRIVKNSEPISLAEGSFAFMRLVLQQPVRKGSGCRLLFRVAMRVQPFPGCSEIRDLRQYLNGSPGARWHAHDAYPIALHHRHGAIAGFPPPS
ncbi:hypothetical protein, partial [Cupriavidus sp.]|uniref:hypothetical protein n=1 Tax=Cupriavidus sp. TaxID=1873897 RepID=UPI0025BA1A9D